MAKAVAVSIAKITAVNKKILRKGITSETFFKRKIELNQDERGFNGFLLDVGAFALEVEFFRHIAVTAADGYEDETNGLIVGGAARTSDAGDADADRRVETFADTSRHFESDGFADGAEIFERLFADVEHGRFNFVGVGYDGAFDVGGTAGDVGESAGEEPAGAGFGAGYCQIFFGENFANFNFHKNHSLSKLFSGEKINAAGCAVFQREFVTVSESQIFQREIVTASTVQIFQREDVTVSTAQVFQREVVAASTVQIFQR